MPHELGSKFRRPVNSNLYMDDSRVFYILLGLVGTEIKVRKKKKVKVSMQTNCYLNLFGFIIMVTKFISSPQTIGLMSIQNYYR